MRKEFHKVEAGDECVDTRAFPRTKPLMRLTETALLQLRIRALRARERDLSDVVKGFLSENAQRQYEIYVRFVELSQAWKKETKFVSNVTKKSMHPAYQQIIGLGESAIPLILDDLKKNGPLDWFWALTCISGENPITADIAGDMHAMTEAWLEWGRKKILVD